MPRRPLARLHFGVIGALIILVAGIGAFPVRITQDGAMPVLNATRFTLPGLAAAVPTGGAAALVAQPVPLTLLSGQTSLDAVVSASNTTEQARSAITAQQAMASAPQASIDGGDTQEKIPIFFEYSVQEGDTLAAIAERFGVGTDYIVWNNVDVHDVNDITPGQILQIPSVEGIVHSVRVDETVTQIATMYDADWREIVDFRANGLAGDPNNITPGSLILVPGGRIVPLAVAPERPGASVLPEVSPSGWVWPAAGNLTSPFSPRHPLGIDVAAPYGTPITAAAAGTVTFVGGNPCCSYGYHVILDHGDGFETLYAHFDSFAVSGGEWVTAGQVIGYMGLTGRTTGSHVHFELRRNGVYQDPLNYLP